MTPYLVIFSLHLLCQVAYTCMMFVEPMARWQRAAWLLLLWGVPIIGIGIGGARFSRLNPGRER